MEDKENKHNPEDTAPETPEVPAEESSEEIKLAELEAKYKEINDKYTRLFAEYDNYRKRTAREKIEWIKAAGEETILKILPVMDDIERGLAHNKTLTDPELLKGGLIVIHQKFKNILSGKGIEEMEAKGKPFDPDLHEAVTSVAAASEDLKGKVIEEIEKGYTLNGKVIRHAKVVVGS